MEWRRLAVFGLGMVILGGSCACSSAQGDAAAAGASGMNAAGASNPSGGEANAGSAQVGTANGGDSGAANGGTGGTGGTASACSEHPTPLHAQGTLVSLALAPTLSGKPFEFGQPNQSVDGGSIVPTNFRFYVSEVQLLSSSGSPVAVDLVNAAGALEPYGVHLFNAEEEDTAVLRVLAPAGDYEGLRFALGLKLSCNQQRPENLGEPLTDVSQMTWPHTGGFLFLRYEGLYTASDGSTKNVPAGIPSVVHMGGSIAQEMVPSVSVAGAFSVPASGSLDKRLGVAMEQIFAGSTAEIDVSDVAVGLLSTPEAIAGERLRRKLPDLTVFALDPAL